MDKPISADSVLQHNRRYIPGGISSVNRSIDPAITFVRGEGAYLWDSEGKRYIDYHAGFAPYFLGRNFKLEEQVEQHLELPVFAVIPDISDIVEIHRS